jgi:hypothetical protein
MGDSKQFETEAGAREWISAQQSTTRDAGLRERLAEAVWAMDDPGLHHGSGLHQSDVDRAVDALLPVITAHVAGLETERDQYLSASRHLALRIREVACTWVRTQPETLRTADVYSALMGIASHVPDRPNLRDDLWQRIVGAYESRFENDGHPEDARAAADEAMSVVRPELDALKSDRNRLKAERDELIAELDGRDEEARERWIQKQLDETRIRAVDFRNGMEMELEAARELLAHQVAAARAMLGDAPNYTETRVSWDVKVAESPEMYTIVIQRHAPGALTPHEARQKAEAERDQLAAAMERVRALHYRDTVGRCSYCSWLDDEAGSGLDVMWPCDTVQALDHGGEA